MAMNDLFIIDTPYVENYFPWKNLIVWDVIHFRIILKVAP